MIKNIILLITGAGVSVFLGWAALGVVHDIRMHDSLEGSPAEIVSGMTLEEKVGQLVHIGILGKKINEPIRKELARVKPGGVILFAHNLGSPEEIRELNLDLQEETLKHTPVPLFISIDQEGGRIKRVEKDGTLQIPSAMAIGQTNDESLARDAAFVTGYEMRKLGFNLILAPVLDINNNPSNPVINTRSFGSSPDRVTRMGWATARGLSDALSTHCIKHFPGHGDTGVDSHLALPEVDKPLSVLEHNELVPFRFAVRNGAEMVMTTHIMFPQLDKKYPATLSKKILTGILRKKLGFSGVIITDALEMHAISKNYSYEKAARLAFNAGADILLLTAQSDVSRRIFQTLMDGFRSGDLSIDALDKSVERQIALKMKKGLFYIHDAPRSDFELTDKYFRTKLSMADRKYEKLQNKYGENLQALNRRLSIEGTVSLKKKISKIDPNMKNKVILFYSSDSVKIAADEVGLKPNNVLTYSSKSAILDKIHSIKHDSIVLIEVNKKQIAEWNSIVDKLSDNDSKVIGFTSANPFSGFNIPTKGGLLVSFSPTEESLAAPVRKIFQEDVPAADLVLP